MENEQPLLTIAIPTYNRSRYLAQLLSVLAPQLNSISGVELLISDNASTDDTGALVGRLAAGGLKVNYIRNPENVGPDRNFLQCYERASGKYLWIVGDDDVIEPFGLQTVFASLQKGPEYEIVFLRARGFTGGYRPAADVSQDKSIVFRRAEDLASHVHVFFTFISGIIVNKKQIDLLNHPAFADLVGTGLVQLSWTYTALEHHRRSLAIETPVIAALTHNTGGYSLFRVFGPTLSGITNRWLTSSRVRRAILHGTLQRFLPFFLARHRTSLGSFVKEDPHTTLCPVFGKDFRYWIFNYPMIRLPAGLAKVWLLGVRAINKFDRMLGDPLLRSW